MKSLNYQHEVAYIASIDRVTQFIDKVVKFVGIFELEYIKKYNKAQDTNLNSEDSMLHSPAAYKYEEDVFEAF
jgi:hypothetical protein